MNEDIKSNARNYTLDAIAGLLILRMIYGHMVGYAGLKNSFLFEICNALYFYMPWFFFKSGMFSQPYRMTVGGVKKEIKRLIVPYTVFTLVGLLTGIIYVSITKEYSIFREIQSQISSLVRLGFIGWSSHLWFLLSLFSVKIMYGMFLYRYNSYFIAFVALSLAFIHNVYIAPLGIIWGGCICSGLFFYLAGKILKDKQYNKGTFIISLIVMVCVFMFRPTFISMFGNFVQNNGTYLVWYPFCFCGIIVTNNLFKSVPRSLLNHLPIQYVGIHSMAYYLSHFSLLLLACRLFHYYGAGSDYMLLSYLCIGAFVLLPVLVWFLNTKKISILIGK